MQITNFVMLTLSLVFGALATPTPDTIVDMVVTDTTSHKRSLEKRFSNAQMTFFEDGFGQFGACGEIIDGSQFVVALNVEQYGNGQHCNQQISITSGGKTATATIVDECPTCPSLGLDLSPALFEVFAPLDKGIITGSWDFV